jgi:hypothetical protein
MYIDPGSGSLVLQIVLAMFLSISVGIRVFWGKIKRLVKSHNQDIEMRNGRDN